MFKFLSRIFGAEKVLPFFPGLRQLKLQNLDLESKLSQQNLTISELNLKNDDLAKEKDYLISGLSQQKIEISELNLKKDNLAKEKDCLLSDNSSQKAQIEKQSQENITLDKEVALLKQDRNYNLVEIQRLVQSSYSKYLKPTPFKKRASKNLTTPSI